MRQKNASIISEKMELWNSEKDGMSLIYNTKRRGPKTLPCESPCIIRHDSDRTQITKTFCVQSERYDLNQSKTVPLIP